MTREEAIKRIKARFDKLGLDDKDTEAIQTLIPELRENEDEKMFREIKRYIKEQGNKPTGLPNGTVAVYDMIDWLEKQKESLHISETCKENADSFTDKDERIRMSIIGLIGELQRSEKYFVGVELNDIIVYLEKQKDVSKAIEAVDRIDKYIDEHVTNAHDMKDSNPDKKYYRGWDDALGKMAGILQDVYSDEKQKDQKPAGCADDVVEEAEEYTSKIACGEYGVEVTEAYIAGVLSERNRGTGWSEEDESQLDDIEKAISNYYDLNHAPQYHYWLEEKLKSLRSQQKEQDVEKYPEDKSFEDEWKDYYNNSLVSRRPMNKREVAKHFYWFVKKNAWKPSDEQMCYLKKVYESYDFCDGERNALESLYNDLLKKLGVKEEPKYYQHFDPDC